MHFDERRVFLFTRERQKFAKVFHKQKGEDSQKFLSRKKAKIRKSIPQEKAEFCKSILSILVFRTSNQIVWVVYKGMKKTFKFIISISEQKLQWQSQDLITCGLHYPSATGLRSREGDEPRPAKRVGRLCSAAKSQYTSFLVIFQCISKQCWPPGDQGKNLKSGQVQLKMKTLPNDCSSDIHKSNTQCGLYQISVFVEDNDSKTRGYTKVPVTNNVRVH